MCAFSFLEKQALTPDQSDLPSNAAVLTTDIAAACVASTADCATALKAGAITFATDDTAAVNVFTTGNDVSVVIAAGANFNNNTGKAAYMARDVMAQTAASVLENNSLV